MDIAQSRRKENIAEYILYLWQLEDLLRAMQFSPEAIYSHYNYTNSVTALRTPVRMGALLGTFGYQYCYKHFIADAWVGAGYAGGKTAETGYYHGFKTWNLFGKNIDNLAMSFSIRLGVVW